MMPILNHYSQEPLLMEKLFNPVETCREFFKPVGLWVSACHDTDPIDDVTCGWMDFLGSNGSSVFFYQYRNQITLVPDARILHLKTVEEIRQFDRQYKTNLGNTSYKVVNWPALVPEYQGILISPYQWSLRHDIRWYYSWDCASGCIWDTTAIEHIETTPYKMTKGDE